jgi:hypothetical protein
MMKRIAAFSISLIILAGCADKNSVRIDGIVKTKEQEKIYLNRIDVDTYVRIDSAKIKKNGAFHFSIKAAEPDFYQIGYSDADFMTVLAEPGEKIRLTFTGKNLYENYRVEGSAGTEKIKMLDSVLTETKSKLDSLKTVYEAASKNPGFDKEGPILQSEYLKIIKEQRNKNIGFILGNLNSFASIKALYQMLDKETFVFYDPRDLQFMKLVSDTLVFHYPNSRLAKALKRDFEKELNNMNIRKLEQAARNAPEVKLDPNLKDIKGNRIALSSLKGKVVLLTFWVTGSEESVAENLSLKELYKLYKSRGFEIYQVNLDENEEAWKNAVKFDELPWISVREDDPKNPVNARLYNVRAVPTNYLYDRDGKIAAANLHGQNLHIRLEQLFAN